MSQPSALELSLRMVHNRRWGQGYRHGRRTTFTPISRKRQDDSESHQTDEDDTVLYIEHFRAQQQLTRKT